jgi:hypothetical protein
MTYKLTERQEEMRITEVTDHSMTVVSHMAPTDTRYYTIEIRCSECDKIGGITVPLGIYYLKKYLLLAGWTLSKETLYKCRACVKSET